MAVETRSACLDDISLAVVDKWTKTLLETLVLSQLIFIYLQEGGKRRELLHLQLQEIQRPPPQYFCNMGLKQG